MRMRIRGRPIESDMARVKSFCSFVARIFVAQSMEEAFATKYVLALSDSTGNGYAEYGSNVVKMLSSGTKHVLILGLGLQAYVYLEEASLHLGWRDAARVDQEGKFTPLYQARCAWRVKESSSTIRSIRRFSTT